MNIQRFLAMSKQHYVKIISTRLFFMYLNLFTVFVAVLYGHTSKAQLCSGSLGDPVVNIAFDASGPSSLVPGYNYVSTSCPADGSYTITSRTSNCFNNTWHTVSDHTGGGNFMLVNASFDPGDFYVDTISGLCPNTTYEFAAWVVNTINWSGIRPDLTFKIETVDGRVLASYNTGSINYSAVPVWKQYGLYFSTPLTEARIVLRITNNAPGGGGNDIGLDDITFRPCGSKIGARIIGQDDTVHICADDKSVYDMEAEVSADYTNPVYFWQLSTDAGKTWSDIPGASTTTYKRMPTGIGEYWYRLAVTEASTAGLKICRIASNALVINVHKEPEIDAGPDRFLIKGNEIKLDVKATGDELSYNWSPATNVNDINVQQPIVNPQRDVEYTVKAVSKYGCRNQDEVFIRVVDDLYIPTAFTPNGDGKNDLWRIPFLDPSLDGEVSLFNRHGKLVYHAKADIIAWDGKVNGSLQPSGVYVYLIKVGKLQFTGTVTLIK